MSENELQVVILHIFLPYLADHPFKLQNHEHFILLRGPASKVNPSTLEIENPVRLGLHEL